MLTWAKTGLGPGYHLFVWEKYVFATPDSVFSVLRVPINVFSTSVPLNKPPPVLC